MVAFGIHVGTFRDLRVIMRALIFIFLLLAGCATAPKPTPLGPDPQPVPIYRPTEPIRYPTPRE